MAQQPSADELARCRFLSEPTKLTATQGGTRTSDALTRGTYLIVGDGPFHFRFGGASVNASSDTSMYWAGDSALGPVAVEDAYLSVATESDAAAVYVAQLWA